MGNIFTKNEDAQSPVQDKRFATHLPSNLLAEGQKLNLLDEKPHEFKIENEDVSVQIQLIPKEDSCDLERTLTFDGHEFAIHEHFENQAITAWAIIQDGIDYVGGIAKYAPITPTPLAECQKQTPERVNDIITFFKKVKPNTQTAPKPKAAEEAISSDNAPKPRG